VLVGVGVEVGLGGSVVVVVGLGGSVDEGVVVVLDDELLELGVDDGVVVLLLVGGWDVEVTGGGE
jgi:hypothetical protein